LFRHRIPDPEPVLHSDFFIFSRLFLHFFIFLRVLDSYCSLFCLLGYVGKKLIRFTVIYFIVLNVIVLVA